jgi:Zn-dependent M28 family amino/carboxypeptidase
LGIRDSLIYPGADDNGSGTSTVLELMRIFSLAEQEGNGPERSVVFLFFSGEEKGLLGSSFFTDNPEIPMSNIVANLNVDMIGRTDATAKDLKDDYIYLIGSDKLSNELHEVSELVNKQFCGMHIDYRYNDPNDPQRLYYRSDHYNFAKHGIPVIFYFRGLHEDYHKPSDTVEKIEFGTIEKVSKLIFHTAWELANRKEKIIVNEALD